MSKKKDDCMEEQPGWYNGQFLDEVGFCCDFICRHPMVCVGGKFFSKEGRIHDENGIKKQIYEMLRPFLKVGLAKNAPIYLKCSVWKRTRTTYPFTRTGCTLPTVLCSSRVSSLNTRSFAVTVCLSNTIPMFRSL